MILLRARREGNYCYIFYAFILLTQKHSSVKTNGGFLKASKKRFLPIQQKIILLDFQKTSIKTKTVLFIVHDPGRNIGRNRTVAATYFHSRLLP